MWRAAALVALAGLMVGCESLLYYGQAVGGHMDLVQRARPIDDVIADPLTPAALRDKLVSARTIRGYAARELALPDNASYGTYSDLGRPYAVWNVYAAAEFSVDPYLHCFPFAGCVSYRGFFDEARARAYGEELRARGFDVYVAGVPAYSTLGWFADPLLNTFINYADAQLARLIFHELAHQVVYARDDTTFNESFATAVEEEGVRRWLEAQGRGKELAAFREGQVARRQYARRVEETRVWLAGLYRTDDAPVNKRRMKAEEFERLRALYGRWVPAEPNNAFLMSISTYTQLVPEFEQMLADSGGDLPAFYARVKGLASTRTTAGRPSSGTPAARKAD